MEEKNRNTNMPPLTESVGRVVSKENAHLVSSGMSRMPRRYAQW